MKIRSFIIAIASVVVIQSCSSTPECVEFWKSYVSRRISSDISELLEANAAKADFDVSPFGENEYYKKQAVAFYLESLEYYYKNFYESEKETDEKWSDPETYINDLVLNYYKVTYSERYNEFSHNNPSRGGAEIINDDNYGDGMREAIDFLNYSYEHPDVTVSNLLKIIPSFEDADNYLASKCSVLECEKDADSSNSLVKVYDVIYMVQCDMNFLGEKITEYYVLAEVSIDENDYSEIKILKQEKNLIDLLR